MSKSMFKRHHRMDKFLEKLVDDTGKRSPIFSTLWDVYYLSFLIGLSRRKSNTSEEIQNQNTVELTSDMANYRSQKFNLIAAALVGSLLDEKKPINDKDTLRKLIEKYVDLENKTFSNEGFELINSYSYSGFLYLSEDLAPQAKDATITFKKIYEYVSQNLN